MEYQIAKDDSTENILLYLDKELGKNLGSNLVEGIKSSLIRNWIESTWVNYQNTQIQAQGIATQRLPSVINWFENAMNFDYGNIYNDFRSDLRSAIKNALQGKAGSSQSIIEKAANAKKALQSQMTDTALTNRYRLVVDNAVSKARNFSQILSFEELGFARFQFQAIIDKKTSNICRVLNGKTVEVKFAVKYVENVLATEPDQVVKKFPWESGKNWPSSPEDIAKADWRSLLEKSSVQLPPFHGFCRTIVTLVEESKMSSTKQDPYKDRPLTDKEIKESQAHQEIAKKTIHSMMNGVKFLTSWTKIKSKIISLSMQ